MKNYGIVKIMQLKIFDGDPMVAVQWYKPDNTLETVFGYVWWSPTELRSRVTKEVTCPQGVKHESENGRHEERVTSIQETTEGQRD